MVTAVKRCTLCSLCFKTVFKLLSLTLSSCIGKCLLLKYHEAKNNFAGVLFETADRGVETLHSHIWLMWLFVLEMREGARASMRQREWAAIFWTCYRGRPWPCDLRCTHNSQHSRHTQSPLTPQAPVSRKSKHYRVEWSAKFHLVIR